MPYMDSAGNVYCPKYPVCTKISGLEERASAQHAETEGRNEGMWGPFPPRFEKSHLNKTIKKQKPQQQISQ